MHTPSEHSGPTLRSLLGQYPIQTCIFRDLDTKSILNLCRTSWHMRRDIRAYLWDINEKLGRFFMNPQAFRTELGRADALISGSFALQFFARRSWPESDLDVYLRDGDGVDHLGQYLVEVEGYDLVPDQRLTLDKDIGTYGADHVSRILTYTKRGEGRDRDLQDMSSISTTTTGKCKVQLIATKSQPAYAILGGYYTTCIMNFISWNKAYCIFPRATLLFHETVPLWFTHSCYSELHQKYSRRGWRMRTEPVAFFRNPQEPDFFLPPPMQNKRRTLQQGRAYPLGYNVTEDRRIGAADTWTVTLSTAGVMRPPQPDSVLDYSSFQIVGHGSQVNALGGIGINICVSLFESPSLRYQYTYGDERPFWTKLDDILWRNTMGQIRVKMSENDVAMLYPDGHHGRVPGGDNTKFQKPAGWDYWDDLIPSLFEEMEEEFMEPYGGQAAL